MKAWKNLFIALSLTALSTVAAHAAEGMTAEQEKALVEAFRYRTDTVLELRYGQTIQENSCNGVCTCTADYKVTKVLRRPKVIEAIKKGDTIKLPFRCSGFKPTSPFSPARWGTRLSNRNILMEVPNFLLENTDQNEWYFGRNRGFVPLYPRNLAW